VAVLRLHVRVALHVIVSSPTRLSAICLHVACFGLCVNKLSKSVSLMFTDPRLVDHGFSVVFPLN